MYRSDHEPQSAGSSHPHVTDRPETDQGQTFAAFFRSAAVPMVLTDVDHRLTAVNQAAARLLGYGAEELRGRHCALIVEDPAALTSPERVGGASLQRKDGQSLTAEISVSRLFDATGAPVAFGAVIRQVEPIEAEIRAAGPLIRADQWPALERANILRALTRSGGKLAGRGGAAELLGTKPSTLRSKMKKLAITRPGQGSSTPTTPRE